MIETWRQCSWSSGMNNGVAGEWFVVIGPLRGGGVIREIRFWSHAQTISRSYVSIAVCGTGERSAANFRSGTPVFSVSDQRNVAGKPSFYHTFVMYAYLQIVLPVSIKVDSGARFVLIGVSTPTDVQLWLSAGVTVIGFARTGADGLGVEDGFDR